MQKSRNTLAIPSPREKRITLLLSEIPTPEALRAVMDLAYPQLHNIAVHYIRNEPRGRTLQATALLHEGCIRLLESPSNFRNKKRGYFFRAASKAMRRVLVDDARHHGAKKRGGNWNRVEFSEAERIGFENPYELLDFDLALARLEKLNAAWSAVTELRIFGQLSAAQTAAVLGIGESTARRHWTQAKTWLRQNLKYFGERADRPSEA